MDVETAAQLAEACEREFPAADVLLMAAAVADYRPAEPRPDKIKKAQAGDVLAVELERTEDVLSAPRPPPAARPGDRRLRGRDGAATRSPRRARSASGRGSTPSSSTMSRRPQIGFDAPDNEVTVVTAEGETAVPRAPKLEVARAIVAAVR